jgi:4a-hydroxytetrahydrobiopterin dehydratase
MNIRELINIVEGKFRSKDIEEYIPADEKLNDLKSKYLPDWEMLDHRTLQAKYVAKDHRHALKFVSFINKLSEKMDHFAEVTQDVAEVTVKTTTFDVKGLTILDFKLAMTVDRYAENNDIEQVRMAGNFGMHEGWSEKYKRSINCSNPRGFSQRAHCQGRKKKKE